MPPISAQLWKSTPFDVQPHEQEPGMITFRLSGPFTARDVFSILAPADLHAILEVPSQARVHCFDLTAVPYMDSAGMTMIRNHETRCRVRGVQLIVVGSGSRVAHALKRGKMEHLCQATARV